jgi:hypothetical protein
MRIIKLDGYNATVDNGKKLELSTFDSYGEEQLQIVKTQNWENLSVLATFNPPNKKPVQVVVDSVTGVIKVPKEATANLYGVGTIVFVGLADGVQRISADVEYIVRKHSNANGTEPAEPTPSVVQQILTEAQNANTTSAEAKKLATGAKDIAQSVRDDADNGKFNGKDGAKGDKGDDGTTPQLKIGEDNLWNVSYDNGETWVSLGVKATGDAGKDGEDGVTPHIGENGNWWLGNTDTGVSAKGPKGDPGPQGPAGEIPEDYPQIREDVSKLKEDTAALKKRQNVLVGSETGNPVSCNDAYSAPLCGLTVYGKSTQDGTPTPDAPVPIVSAGDGGSVVVKVSDGNGKEQTLTLQTPTGLPGIPVTSGGNYTDQNGQQWICDEVDLERGVRVQMVTTMVFSDSSGFAASSTTNGIRFLRAVKNLKITDTDTADANAFCSALALGANGGTWLTPDVFTITKTALYVRFKNITSLGELQQYLQQTPMSLTAILATPIETPLFPAEIAAYKALTAYAPDTVVQESDGAGIKLDYQRDVNLVVKNLEDAIASMTTT